MATDPEACSTRSGKGFSPYLPIHCPLSFDFAALLQESTNTEAEILEKEEEEEAAEDLSPLPPPAIQASTSFGAPTLPSLKRHAGLSIDHARRKRRHEEKAIKEGHKVRPEVLQQHVKPAVSILAPVDFAKFPSTAGAYSAKIKKPTNPSVVHSVDGLRAEGFVLEKWDGYTSRPLVDKEGRVIAVLAGQPRDLRYQQSCINAYNLIKKKGEKAIFSENEQHHRCGHFPAINVGVTHGKGTQAPIYLNNHRHTDMMEHLLIDDDVKRLATFASNCFSVWAPEVYAYYKNHLDALFEKMPHLRRIFPKSVYPSAAFNFGTNVWTYKHRDVLNCPFRFCAIQALGNFDPVKGGHLVLWELKLIIEFPPGSLVLIPSATVTHSNIPVAEKDERASFTQYCAGGLFRYVDYGFRKEKDLKKRDRLLYAEMCRLKPDKWKIGLSLLSKLEDLQS